MTEQLLEPGEVADILGVSTERVRQMAGMGVLFPVKKGKRSSLYSRDNVEAVAEARRAGEDVKRQFEERGLSGPAVDMADRATKKALREIARRNFQAATRRARERLADMERRLEELDTERIPFAAALKSIDSERDYLAGAIERLSAELDPTKEDSVSYFGPRTAEDWSHVINLWLLDGYTPLETVQALIGDYPEWEQEIRDGLEMVPDLQIDNAEWEEERQNHWRREIGLPPLPPVDYSTGDPLAVRPSFYRPVMRRPGGRAAHRRESRSSGDDDDHEDAVRAFLEAIDRWEQGL